jgi:hypothetical protein
VGRSRRVTSAVLVLAIAALAGIAIGEALARMLDDGGPQAQVVATAPAALAPSEPSEPTPSSAPVRELVIALDIDRTMRLDGGAPLDAARLEAALRPRVPVLGVVHVAPGAGVPWVEVVDLVDRLRSLGVRVSLHAPPE